MYIYADNAATTKISESAIAAMLSCMKEHNGNPSSLHSDGQDAAEILDKSREEIAQILGCLPSEITFTSGGSESDNQALVSAAVIGARKNKKHIISTTFEHHAVLHTLEHLKTQGYEITLLNVSEKGMVDPELVKESIRDDTCLVSVMYANNEIGTVQDIKKIGAICREKGVLFHTDAVQAAGHIKINVNEENIDMLSLSAHKFNGPKGTGVLFARKGIRLTNVIYGGAQERGKRAGTENLPAIAGMAAALKESYEKIDEVTPHIIKARDKIIEGLEKIPHSVVNGDRNMRLPGNVHMCFEGIEGESLLLLLDNRGIKASSGSACTSGSLDPSHVLLAIGRPHEIAHGSLRLTIDETITDEQVKYIIDNVTEVVTYLRNMSPLWRDKVNGIKPFYI